MPNDKARRDDIEDKAVRDADAGRHQYPHNKALPNDKELEDNRLYEHVHKGQSKK